MITDIPGPQVSMSGHGSLPMPMNAPMPKTYAVDLPINMSRQDKS